MDRLLCTVLAAERLRLLQGPEVLFTHHPAESALHLFERSEHVAKKAAVDTSTEGAVNAVNIYLLFNFFSDLFMLHLFSHHFSQSSEESGRNYFIRVPAPENVCWGPGLRSSQPDPSQIISLQVCLSPNDIFRCLCMSISVFLSGS